MAGSLPKRFRPEEKQEAGVNEEHGRHLEEPKYRSSSKKLTQVIEELGPSGSGTHSTVDHSKYPFEVMQHVREVHTKMYNV